LELLGVVLVTLWTGIEPKFSTLPELSAALREASTIAAPAVARTGVEITAETASATLPLLAKRERRSSSSAVGPGFPSGGLPAIAAR
jgi:hypothetical protein